MGSIKTNFIVVTGGPGGGKSTLLDALGKKGFKYINETGRTIIKERISKGLSPRPDLEEFAKLMFQRDYENYINHLYTAETLFFDRSFLDSASFIQQTNKIYFEKVNEIIHSLRFNNNIFITPPWEEIYCNDDERDQTFSEAVDTYNSLYNWYELNGYKLIVLPKVPVEMRVKFVLSELSLS